MRLRMQSLTLGTGTDMADTPDYVNGEPEPIHNFNPSVHDLLVNDAKHLVMGFGSCRIEDTKRNQMIDLFRERKRYGLNKYGTVLQAENGRDFLRDALDEIVDCLAYVRMGLEENPLDHDLDRAYTSCIHAFKNLLAFAKRSKIEIVEPSVSNCASEDEPFDA